MLHLVPLCLYQVLPFCSGVPSPGHPGYELRVTPAGWPEWFRVPSLGDLAKGGAEEAVGDGGRRGGGRVGGGTAPEYILHQFLKEKKRLNWTRGCLNKNNCTATGLTLIFFSGYLLSSSPQISRFLGHGSGAGSNPV